MELRAMTEALNFLAEHGRVGVVRFEERQKRDHSIDPQLDTQRLEEFADHVFES
jgi:hypothetical protein